MVEVTKEFPISKEEMFKRAQEVLGASKILEVEQRGKSLVMLLENSQGNFVVRMTFFHSDEGKKADLCFKGEKSDESGVG